MQDRSPKLRAPPLSQNALERTSIETRSLQEDPDQPIRMLGQRRKTRLDFLAQIPANRDHRKPSTATAHISRGNAISPRRRQYFARCRASSALQTIVLREKQTVVRNG